MISSCRQMDEHPPLLRSTPFKGGRSWNASCSKGCVSKANLSYEYRGDGKRHSRTAGGVTTRYGWDMGWNVIHEESAGGTLQRSFVGNTLAHVDGTNPALGTWTYYLHDHLGSVRKLRNQARAHVASRQYTPYGDIQSESGTFTATRGFTGHDLDASTGLYYAPFRQYSPTLARWLTGDPLGMVDGPNVYAYVRGNPVNIDDPLGLFSSPFPRLRGRDIRDAVWREIRNSARRLFRRVADNLKPRAIFNASISLNDFSVQLGADCHVYLCWGLTTQIIGVAGSVHANPQNISITVGTGYRAGLTGSIGSDGIGVGYGYGAGYGILNAFMIPLDGGVTLACIKAPFNRLFSKEHWRPGGGLFY